MVIIQIQCAFIIGRRLVGRATRKVFVFPNEDNVIMLKYLRKNTSQNENRTREKPDALQCSNP